MKKLLIFALISIMIILPGCGTDKNEDVDINGHVSITITNDLGEEILSKNNVPFHAEDSVYDILMKVCKDEKIAVVSEGTDEKAFIKGIGGLMNMDKGDESFWIYRVNDQNPPVGCGLYTVNDKDVIQWVYITSLDDFEM